MWQNKNFNFETDLRKKMHINRTEMLKVVENLLNNIRAKAGNNGSNYIIYQHLIWLRDNTLEEIISGVFNYGLRVKSPCISSTTNITGNLAEISAEDVLNYYYDTSINCSRDNLGFIIPKTIIDEKGRVINLALDKKPANIRWNEGYYSAMIDFLLDLDHNLSNAYSLFHFELQPLIDKYSYSINTQALPFLSKQEQVTHDLELAKQIKNVLVNVKKIVSEEEYDNAQDINPFIEQLIADKLAVTEGPYISPDYWEFP